MTPFPYDGTTPRKISQDEETAVHDCLQHFAQLQTARAVFASHWEEVSELVRPNSRNTFFFGSYNTPGQKKTDRQVDATGMMALSRFGAICDSLLTPRNTMWHGLSANDDYVMKDRATRLWFEDTTNRLFKYRYAPAANFTSQNQNIFQDLGAFGNGAMFTDPLDPRVSRTRGLRYRGCPLGEMFFQENHQGQVIGCIRWFRLTAFQAEQKWPGRLPEGLHTALKQQSQQQYNFLHRIMPREDVDYERLDAKGMPWSSHYVSLEGHCLMEDESGYNTFPVAATRYEQAPGEPYGRGPAMMVLPALKTLNAEKRTFLKQGHRAADPVLLTSDDGLVDFNMRPGALNKGGMNSDGKPLVGILPTGEIQISLEMMQQEQTLINDAFLVSLFQILTESPQMTATEVIERTNEKGILLAPTIGRQQSEYLGPLIDRELDVLASQGLLLPQPPRLREAMGHYRVVYTSPLSRAAKANEAAGFMRTLEAVKELVGITGDPSLLDTFEFDTAVPAIADIQAVPFSWMATPESIAQKRKARAQQMAQKQQIDAMPAKAAMLKAQAKMAETAGGQGTPLQ